MPSTTEAHVDQILTNLSIAYPAPDVIWQKVLPQIKVAKRSDKYYVYSKDDLHRIYADAIGPTAYANEVDYDLSTDNYSVEDHALEGWVSQAAIDNQDQPLDLMRDKTEFIARWLNLAQEARTAAVVFNSASYPTANKVTLSGTSQWGGSADDPINDVLAAVEGCFVRANTLVFGADTWLKFRALPEILDAVKSSSRYQGSPGGLATQSEVASLFEIDNLLIGRARYNTAKKGQTGAYSRVWGKHCSALYVEPSPTTLSITFGATFSEMNFETVRGFDERRGVKGSHFIKTAWNTDEKIIASDTGYMIVDAVA